MHRLLPVLFILLFVSVPVFAASSDTDVPLGQTSSADDLFDTQRGYFHPFLSISEVYTDNLFNTQTDNNEEFITIITPGIWLAFPGLMQPAEPINTSTTAVGGQSLSRFGERDDRPFQTFLNYEAGIKRHKNFNSEDITTHKLHGLARVTFTSGLSFEVNDVYDQNHDAYATGISTGQNEFSSNLVSVNSQIPIGERFKLQINYSNFLVDYDTAANSFRDRSDNKIASYLHYAYSQKTKFFVQYSFLDVSYDNNTTNDNEQHRTYLGIDYDLSEKLQLLAKVGFSTKDRNGSQGDRDDFIFEVQSDYQFTPKNNLNLLAWRQLKESDTPGTNGILGSAFTATFSQMLGQKVVATAIAGWARDEYSGAITVGPKTAEREDDYMNFSLALSYSMQKWFEISGGYNYVKRDSSFSTFNYDSNEIFLNLTGNF